MPRSTKLPPTATSSLFPCLTKGVHPSCSLFPVPILARLRIIFGSAGIGIGGVLPIGTAFVTEFAPPSHPHDHDRPAIDEVDSYHRPRGEDMVAGGYPMLQNSH